MKDQCPRLLAALVLMPAALWSAVVWASGFQIRENSASALGNAFAGAAALPEDPSIIANNPAGMIGLTGNQVSGDIAIVAPSTVFSGMGFTAARQPISGGNGGDAGGPQVGGVVARVALGQAHPEVLGLGAGQAVEVLPHHLHDGLALRHVHRGLGQPAQV